MSPPPMYLPSSGDTNPTPSPQAPATIGSLPDELLLAILGGFSVTDRAKVRRVSKKWNDLVMDIGIHLEPMFVDDQMGIPFYSSDITIRQNLWSLDLNSDGLRQTLEADLPHAELTRLSDFFCFVLHEKRSQFLTYPSISTLALHVSGLPGTSRQPIHAILRTATPTTKRAGGIRLGDLLDVFDKMRAYDTKLSLEGWSFVAWFAMEKDGFETVKVGERTTRNGIEVRKCIAEVD